MKEPSKHNTTAKSSSSMRELFPGNYKPDIQVIKEIWQDCIFILDTNVILNLFRFAQPEREAVLKLLESIGDRLWIPHQVALEFQMNRLTLIHDRIASYDTVIKKVGELETVFQDALRAERLQGKEIDELLEKIREGSSGLISYLEAEKRNEQVALIEEEGLHRRIDNLFTDRIGDAPVNQEWLEGVYKDGKQRQAFLIPPSFMDKKKNGAYSWRGMRFEREHGDLIIWKQILNFSLQRSINHIIFVTDDGKNDWWETIKGKRVGPRPELVNELIAFTPASKFLMYDSVQFFTHANNTFGTRIKHEAIEKIREAIASSTSLNYNLKSIGTTNVDFDLNIEVSSQAEIAVDVNLSEKDQEFIFYFQVWSPLGFYWIGYTNRASDYTTERENTKSIAKNDIGRYFIQDNIAETVERRFPDLQGQALRIVRLRGRGDGTNQAPVGFSAYIKR